MTGLTCDCGELVATCELSEGYGVLTYMVCVAVAAVLWGALGTGESCVQIATRGSDVSEDTMGIQQSIHPCGSQIVIWSEHDELWRPIAIVVLGDQVHRYFPW